MNGNDRGAASINLECTVYLKPLGQNVICERGEVLMQAALKAGLQWPTACGGVGKCGRCYVTVESSQEALDPPSAKEEKVLSMMPPHLQKDFVRLACQLRVTADMVVFRSGVLR